MRKSRTDLRRVGALKDKQIDLSDLPEVPPAEFARAVVRYGPQPVPKKKHLTLRVDTDVIAWFKAQGRGYQTRINRLLRAYMQAHKP